MKQHVKGKHSTKSNEYNSKKCNSREKKIKQQK